MKTIFFIHGFSAKKEDNQDLLDYLKKKRVKVYTFTLPGHFENKVEKVPYQEWLTSSEEELKQILKKEKEVILIGHSMGGAIASILTSKYPEIKKLILISPAFDVGSFLQNKEDIKNVFLKKVDKKLGTGFEGILKKALHVPKGELKEVKKMADLALSSIEKVTAQTLLLHGTIDHVVAITSSIEAYAKLTCKKHFTVLTDVRHQVFKSHKRKEIETYIYRFIQGGLPWMMAKKNQL